MNTHIYLVRHGEVFNPKGILYGRLPRYGLSEKGRKEIEHTGAFLKDKDIDIIYSSPLLRARQTAEIIRAQTNIKKVILTNYLLEIRTSYQGKPFASLSPDQREVYFAPQPEDETLEQVAKRLQKFINILIEKHTGKHIVLVSHGDPLMLLRSILNGLPIAYTSVREGNGVKYFKHGEVVEINIDEKREKTVKSIFKPK